MAANSLGRWLGLVVILGWVSAASAAESGGAADAAPAVENNVTQGALRIVQKDGGIVECPLKHTDVQADIAGFVARVKVTQTFHNPTKEKIEAVRSEERRVGKECRCRRGPYVEKREGQK